MNFNLLLGLWWEFRRHQAEHSVHVSLAVADLLLLHLLAFLDGRHLDREKVVF